MNWITFVFVIAQCIGPSVQFELCNKADFTLPEYQYRITQEGSFLERGKTPQVPTGECYAWPPIDEPGEIRLEIFRLGTSTAKTCTLIGDPPAYMLNTYLPKLHGGD